jgi:hypothetical protein
VRPRLLPAFVVACAIAAAGVVLASCSSVVNERIGIDAPPFSEATFAPLNGFLVGRCGTLDCHGQPGRNFRIWGCDGMRLDAGQQVTCVPNDAGGGLTTIYELQATYRSMVGLEPQVMSQVYAGCYGQVSTGRADYPPPGACHPELLTMVEKARGLEAHKGGQLFCLAPPCPPGIPDPSFSMLADGGPPLYDPQDVCLVSWLEGEVNVTACTGADNIGFPPADASTE